MRLKSVRIENVKGIVELEFRMGAMTVLVGGNGVGKSSAIDAVASNAVRRGKLARCNA